MILVCPYCGSQLLETLVDGIASCIKCSRAFDSSTQNRLLSASWLVRKNNYSCVEQLISDTKLPEYEAILVFSFISDNAYSQEEFSHAITKLGISKSILS